MKENEGRNNDCYNPLVIYAILRIYGASGIEHYVITNGGIQPFGARLPPFVEEWLLARNHMDFLHIIAPNIYLFGRDKL